MRLPRWNVGILAVLADAERRMLVGSIPWFSHQRRLKSFLQFRRHNEVGLYTFQLV